MKNLLYSATLVLGLLTIGSTLSATPEGGSHQPKKALTCKCDSLASCSQKVCDSCAACCGDTCNAIACTMVAANKS